MKKLLWVLLIVLLVLIGCDLSDSDEKSDSGIEVRGPDGGLIFTYSGNSYEISNMLEGTMDWATAETKAKNYTSKWI